MVVKYGGRGREDGVVCRCGDCVGVGTKFWKKTNDSKCLLGLADITPNGSEPPLSMARPDETPGHIP